MLDLYNKEAVAREKEDQLEIKWLPQGKAFLIREDDGSESLMIKDNSGWSVV